MHTLTTRIAALAGTIFMTTLMMSTVGYCFALQSKTDMTAVAFTQPVITRQALG
jgi:hypothetical protein